MKICVDARCLIEGRRTGVEEYTLGLLLNLFELDQKNEYLLFLSSWKKPKFNFSVFAKYTNVKIKKNRIPNKILNFSFWYLNWPKIDKLVGGADIVFFPNIIFGAVSKNIKVIATIHDLSFERYPEYFSWKRRFWHIFINSKKICRRADKIIAISDSTASDISSLYEIGKEKINIIPSAIADNFHIINRNDKKLLEVKEKYNLPFKFILYLGTIEPRKNILGIIRAYNKLQSSAETSVETGLKPVSTVACNDEIAKYKLVIAGSSGWLGEEFFEEIERSKFKEKIILPGFIEDCDKPFMYNLSSLFIYPSFFEGFGFPPLEAMSCGVPIIASNNSSLPEICGNAAILIDPHKPEEICEAMKQILSDKALREKLVQKGMEKSKEFNWKKTAEKTLKMFVF
ncbi:MAG TPA: glycosyltransferase family 1 protein [Candidatus Moranbacteria bacterium]|nr:glycosyltransferase family 1 protein [Candidatus Moranbacteria bacterium]HAT75250.1 glycosyltransferase family 1 protein [Candidatus Moranbacteria bacterium]